MDGEADYAVAQLRLGNIYARGEGVPPDSVAALRRLPHRILTWTDADVVTIRSKGTDGEGLGAVPWSPGPSNDLAWRAVLSVHLSPLDAGNSTGWSSGIGCPRLMGRPSPSHLPRTC